MALVREQFFEGAVAGTAMDTTNSDYETFFGTARFSASNVRQGNTSAEFYAGATATATYARYSFTETPVRYLSRYRTMAIPPGTTTMYRFRRVGTTQFLLRMTSAGLYAIADSGSVIQATMIKPIVANQMHRLEIDVVNQTVTMRLYLGSNMDGLTPDDTISATLVFPSGSGSGAFDDYDEGFITARANYSIFVDAIRDGDTASPGPYVEPGLISTSTVATATAYSNQRKIDRTSNGVLWTFYTAASGTGAPGRTLSSYSTDDGVTWNSGTPLAYAAASNYVANSSFFIDIDDYAHVVYKNPQDGYIYYVRGTPNTERTAWTWSPAKDFSQGSPGADYPDVIAHKDGTGWMVHVTVSWINGVNNNWAGYSNISITSSGTMTQSRGGLAMLDGWFGKLGNYFLNIHTYPSIDFNHTGDGKTVKDGTPHLYAAWSAGAAGAGKGIRFKKATYSGGTWTWGTEREIDSTRFINNTTQWVNCLFDGARVIIPAMPFDGTDVDIVLYERDAADTATVTRVLVNNAPSTLYISNGSSSYDDQGNVYFLGRNNSTSYSLSYRKWTRSTETLESAVDIYTNGAQNPYASARRGYSGAKIEFIYTDGTASPYSVKYGSINIIPPLSATDFSIRLTTNSGSSGNTTAQTDPNLSLGGFTSTTEVDWQLFDDVTPQENKAGRIEYRAVDIVNNHPTESFNNVFAHPLNTGGGAVVKIAPDPTGPLAVDAADQMGGIPDETTDPPNLSLGYPQWPVEMLTDTQRFAEVDDGAWWNWTGSTISTDHAHSGVSSWKAPATDNWPSADINSRMEYQYDGGEGLNAPVNWTFSGWFYQETGGTRTIQVAADPGEDTLFQNISLPSGQWTYFSFSGTSRVFMFYINPSWWVDVTEMNDWQAGEYFYFDDMSVVYEPVNQDPNNVYVGDIGPGQMQRLWLRREVLNSDEVLDDGFTLYLTADGANGMNSYTATSEGTAQSPTWGLPTQFSSATFSVSTDRAHSGSNSLKVTSPDYEGVGVTVYDTDPTTNMLFSGWIYQGSGAPQSFSFAGMNDFGYYEDAAFTIPSGVWTRFESLIEPGYPGVVVYPTETTLTFYLDDLAYTKGNLVGPVMSPDSVQMLSPYQITSEGKGVPWTSTSTSAPSTVSTAHFHTGKSSWTLTAPDYNELVFPVNEIDWFFRVWVYHEAGADRSVGIGVDSIDNNWTENSFTVPSGVWTQLTLSNTSSVKDIYIFATTGWSAGETLYFDDADFSVSPPEGWTVYWNTFAFKFPAAYVWDGSALVSGHFIGVWNGTEIDYGIKAPYLWSPYTANYEGVY